MNRLKVFLLLIAMVPACAPTQQADEMVAATPTAKARPSVASAPPSILPADEGCTVKEGVVEQVSIESAYYDHGVTFRVYTPPCYEQFKDGRYPVLYLIHGQGFLDDQWDRIGADEVADELIRSGEITPFIIVMPYDNYSLRPTVGFFDEAFLDELVPWIDENYPTIANREHRAIGGLSRGASWAIHFALTEPEIFGALGGHSPPVFIEEAKKVIEWLDAIPASQMPRIWLDIGDRDTQNIKQSAEFFEGLLAQRGIPHAWHVFPGDHSEEYWSSHVEEYLRWYAEGW